MCIRDRLWAEHVRTEPAHFSLAHRRAGDLYAGAHRLHRVHLLQLHADRRGVGGGQRPCALLLSLIHILLVDGSTPGNDMRYSEKKVEAARNFANKLWNATRFVLMNLPEDFQPGLPSEEKLDMSDKWVLTKLNQVAGAMSDNRCV